MSTTRGEPGLPGITRDGGERLATGVRRRARAGRAPGSVLIAVAAWLLALTAAARWSSRSAPSNPTSAPSAARTRPA